MLWGYHRCSTKDQHLDRGEAELKNYFETFCPSEKYKIFTDKVTGKKFDRTHYNILKELVEEGDIVVFTEMDRVGRNKQGILKELQYYKEMGVFTRVLEIPTTLINFNEMDNALARMMMETINNLLIEMYATFAHAEMEKKEKRQREGIEQMKLRGEWEKYGRPQLVTERQFKLAYKNVASGEITAVECMKQLGVCKTTFYNMRKKYIIDAKE